MKRRPILKALKKGDFSKMKEVLMNPAADLRPLSVYDKPNPEYHMLPNDSISLLYYAFQKCDIELFNLLLNDCRIYNSFFEIEFTLFHFSLLGEKKVDSEYVTLMLNKGNKRAISYILNRHDGGGYIKKMYKPIHREDLINKILDL